MGVACAGACTATQAIPPAPNMKSNPQSAEIPSYLKANTIGTSGDTPNSITSMGGVTEDVPPYLVEKVKAHVHGSANLPIHILH